MNALTITPITFHRDSVLHAAMERIHLLEEELQKLRSVVASPNRNIRIHQTNRVITAAVADIAYIQAENNYSRIFMKDGVQYYTSRTLKSWAKELSGEDFLRCHRTYLVNRESIAEVNRLKSVIMLRGGIAIPTSRRFQKGCLAAIFSNTIKSESQYLSHQPVIHQLTSRSISPLG